MLSKLFRNRAKLDDPDANARRHAVDELSDTDSGEFQADLAELARQDPDPGVRRSAAGRLSDLAALAAMLEDAPPVADVAADRIVALADDGQPLPETLASHPSVRFARIRAATDPDDVEPALAALDEGTMMRLAVRAKNPRVRSLIAGKVSSEAALTELERTSRDKDKNVNRQARNGLEAIKQARGQLAKAARRADELLHAIETAARQAPDSLFAARLGVIKQDWHDNEAKIDDIHRRLAVHDIGADDRVAPRAQFDRAADTAGAKVEALAPAPPVVPPGTNENYAELLTGFEELLDALTADAPDVAALKARYAGLSDTWLATSDHQPVPEATSERFHGITHRLNEVLAAWQRIASQSSNVDAVMQPRLTPGDYDDSEDAFVRLWKAQQTARTAANRTRGLLEAIAWPEPTVPAAVTALRGRLETLDAFDTHCHDAHERLKDRLSGVIDKLSETVEDGNLKTALGLSGEGRRLTRCLPAHSARRLQQDFNALTARVQELKDWQTFATSPKREELLAAVTELAAAPLPAPEQAERIKALRAEWKSLGAVGNAHDRRLLDQFNAAAERAFEPCREFFEQQAERRKDNLARREQMIEELTGYLEHTHWDAHPDWKTAERILHTARSEWRNYHPVDRGAGRKQQTRFDKLMEALHGHLKGEWDRNVARKEAIVAEAEGLTETPTAEAVPAIKTLQRRWQEVGITPRRVDQRLWKQFRSACDAVFGHRDQARESRRARFEDTLRLAQEVVDQFQSALEHATTASASLAELNDFSQRYHRLGEVPREGRGALQQRFNEVQNAYRNLLKRAERESLFRQVDDCRAADERLAALERDLAEARIDIDGLRSAAAEDDAIARLPAAVVACRLEHAGSDAVAALEAQRRLVIEMEMQAGVETPAEDKELKLRLQVERLNQGFGRNAQAEAEPETLAERWCEIGPASEASPGLRDRFFDACRHALE